MSELHRGSCLCGAVAFQVEGPLGKSDACHCVQCRKQSGHYWASTDVPRQSLKIDSEQELRWYQSSEKVRRGFCGRCGSFLFWDPMRRDRIAVAMGALDGLTGIRLGAHIFVEEKGDYYSLADGLPQHPR